MQNFTFSAPCLVWSNSSQESWAIAKMTARPRRRVWYGRSLHPALGSWEAVWRLWHHPGMVQIIPLWPNSNISSERHIFWSTSSPLLRPTRLFCRTGWIYVGSAGWIYCVHWRSVWCIQPPPSPVPSVCRWQAGLRQHTSVRRFHSSSYTTKLYWRREWLVLVSPTAT